MINGYATAFLCPPMNRLFYVPRSAALEDLIDKYPSESKKDKKEREKLDELKRQKIRTESEDTRKLVVDIINATELSAKDLNGTSDPYALITIKEQSFKTTIQKKNIKSSLE